MLIIVIITNRIRRKFICYRRLTVEVDSEDIYFYLIDINMVRKLDRDSLGITALIVADVSSARSARGNMLAFRAVMPFVVKLDLNLFVIIDRLHKIAIG